MSAKVYKFWGFRQFGWITLTGILIFGLLNPRSFINFSFFLENWRSFLITLVFTYSLAYSSSYISAKLDPVLSWLHQPVKKFLLHFFTLGLFSFIISAIVFYVFVLLLFGRGEWLSWSSVLSQAKLPALISIIISAIFTSVAFLQNWKSEAVRAERLEKEKIASQYESLRNQVNPHFLFNSLNALSELVYENQELAVKYIRQLSQVYRYVLDSRNHEVVPVHEELTFLESFIFLQKIRFGENMKVTVSISDQVNKFILPLSMQLLFENAVKHNIISSEEPLEISIYEEDDYLILKNRLNKKKSTGEGSGIGLENIIMRYKYLTEKPVLVKEEKGYFMVKVPLLTLQP